MTKTSKMKRYVEVEIDKECKDKNWKIIPKHSCYSCTVTLSDLISQVPGIREKISDKLWDFLVDGKVMTREATLCLADSILQLFKEVRGDERNDIA